MSQIAWISTPFASQSWRFLSPIFSPFHGIFLPFSPQSNYHPHQDFFRGRENCFQPDFFFTFADFSNLYLWLFSELFVAISGRAFQTGPISVHYSAGVFYSGGLLAKLRVDCASLINYLRTESNSKSARKKVVVNGTRVMWNSLGLVCWEELFCKVYLQAWFLYIGVNLKINDIFWGSIFSTQQICMATLS